jgi:hypothetical protein
MIGACENEKGRTWCPEAPDASNGPLRQAWTSLRRCMIPNGRSFAIGCHDVQSLAPVPGIRHNRTGSRNLARST